VFFGEVLLFMNWAPVGDMVLVRPAVRLFSYKRKGKTGPLFLKSVKSI